jgi:hypothetical protein
MVMVGLILQYDISSTLPPLSSLISPFQQISSQLSVSWQWLVATLGLSDRCIQPSCSDDRSVNVSGSALRWATGRGGVGGLVQSGRVVKQWKGRSLNEFQKCLRFLLLQYERCGRYGKSHSLETGRNVNLCSLCTDVQISAEFSAENL